MKLKQFSIHGRIFAWIRDFLFNMTIHVRVANTLSPPFCLDNSIQQGSVIGPALVSIKADDLACLPFSVRLSRFADQTSLHKFDSKLLYA